MITTPSVLPELIQGVYIIFLQLCLSITIVYEIVYMTTIINLVIGVHCSDQHLIFWRKSNFLFSHSERIGLLKCRIKCWTERGTNIYWNEKRKFGFLNWSIWLNLMFWSYSLYNNFYILKTIELYQTSFNYYRSLGHKDPA